MKRTENQYIRSWFMLVPLIQATHTHHLCFDWLTRLDGRCVLFLSFVLFFMTAAFMTVTIVLVFAYVFISEGATRTKNTLNAYAEHGKEIK